MLCHRSGSSGHPGVIFGVTGSNVDFHNTVVNTTLSNQAIFCNMSKQGGIVATPSLDFLNQTPYEIGFGINR